MTGPASTARFYLRRRVEPSAQAGILPFYKHSWIALKDLVSTRA